ncbi:MAG: saccharopine dehydrogenase family protein [Sandaracinaceae bacterium]
MVTRDRSREHDIVLWGATGFTGQLVAEYLAPGAVAGEIRLALAGRSREKLEAVRRELETRVPGAAALPLLTADAMDEPSLQRLAERTSVVCTTVGPYARYGEGLVAACVEKATDYCDLTGEPQFVRRMIDRHQASAEASGARIVHCCGYDSIPSDLGTLMVQEEALARFGRPAEEVKGFAGETSGGFSGGTVASLLHVVDEARRDREVRRILGHPYGLNPEGERQGPDGSDQRGVGYDEDLGMWTAPFVMASVNTRVVRRSNALLGYRYGRDFRYAEAMSCGRGLRGWTRAATVTAGLGAFMAAMTVEPTRKLMEARVLPKPGEGPSRGQREAGFFRFRFAGKGLDAEGKPFLVRGLVEGQQDPGYGETAKMLGEAARCLALDGADLEAPGGIRTPASTMGARLIERLRGAGMTFEVRA